MFEEVVETLLLSNKYTVYAINLLFVLIEGKLIEDKIFYSSTPLRKMLNDQYQNYITQASSLLKEKSISYFTCVSS